MRAELDFSLGTLIQALITRADHFYCRLPSKSTYNVDILKLLSMSDYKSQVDFKQKKKIKDEAIRLEGIGVEYSKFGHKLGYWP